MISSFPILIRFVFGFHKQILLFKDINKYIEFVIDNILFLFEIFVEFYHNYNIYENWYLKASFEH